MNTTLAVTGITGHTGGFFLRELEERAFPGTVRCLVRPESDTSALDRAAARGLRVEIVRGDVRDAAALRTLLRGCGAVMHIAFLFQSVSVVKTALEEGVRRAVLIHTTGVYSKYKMASGEYRAIEAELEALLREANRDGARIDVTILRPTMIFGDLRDHNIHHFIRMVDRLPLMPEIDHGRGKLQPVNARDLARACRQALEAENLPRPDYVISGERALTLHELCVQIGACLGKRTRFVSVPMGAGVFLARALKGATFGKRDLVEKVLRMGEDRAYAHDAATADFGYAPEPFDTGLRREVDAYLRAARGGPSQKLSQKLSQGPSQKK